MIEQLDEKHLKQQRARGSFYPESSKNLINWLNHMSTSDVGIDCCGLFT